MGLFDRIYQQGHGGGQYVPPSTDYHVGAEEAPRPPTPPPRPVYKEEGASPFAWGVLGLFGLFGLGYLARAFQRPVAPPPQENEEE